VKIDANLNLALPVRVSEDGDVLVWAYHTPISTEAFATNYRIISETSSRIWGKGLKYAATSGPRIASLTLLDISEQDAAENELETPLGPALLAEIKRLTFILAPGANGFDMLPVDAAVQRGVIDSEDWSEAESSLVFFTLGYAMSRRAGRKTFCELISSVMAGSVTSLTPTEFAASLKTSTPVAATEQPPAVEQKALESVPQ